MKTYIAIDWGLRKVGTAFGDDQTKIAFAGTLLENDEEIYERLVDLARTHEAEAFLIGTTQNDLQSDNCDVTHQFAKRLVSHAQLAVIPVEEMFSTRQAQANLKQAEKSSLAADDIEAARIMLQDFLDQ